MKWIHGWRKRNGIVSICILSLICLSSYHLACSQFRCGDKCKDVHSLPQRSHITQTSDSSTPNYENSYDNFGRFYLCRKQPVKIENIRNEIMKSSLGFHSIIPVLCVCSKLCVFALLFSTIIPFHNDDVFSPGIAPGACMSSLSAM